jgi:hypothetical protein
MDYFDFEDNCQKLNETSLQCMECDDDEFMAVNGQCVECPSRCSKCGNEGQLMSAILATNQMVVIANKSVTMGANHAQRRRPIAQPALMAFSLAELAALTAITRV